MAPRACPAPRSVLVVDDEPGIREFLALILGELGYAVRTVPDGAAALAVLAEERPDVVVTDLMMPHLSGWELCRRLRQDPATCTLPLVVISAVRAEGVPADVVLAKPFSTDALLTALEQLLAAPPAPTSPSAVGPAEWASPMPGGRPRSSRQDRRHPRQDDGAAR